MFKNSRNIKIVRIEYRGYRLFGSEIYKNKIVCVNLLESYKKPKRDYPLFFGNLLTIKTMILIRIFNRNVDKLTVVNMVYYGKPNNYLFLYGGILEIYIAFLVVIELLCTLFST